MNRAWIGIILTLTLGCRPTGTTRDKINPKDMSAVAHEEAAAAEEQEAQAHIEAAKLYPDQGVRSCHEVGVIYFPCWSQMANMVDYNLFEAKQHERRAKEHIAAAVVLRDAENRSCQSISVEDKEISPFYHTQDISAVLPVFSSKDDKTPIGADVTFRKIPGMTKANLQQIIDCQMARNAALGYDQSWMPSCPLMLKEISATVVESQEGFVVNLRAKDPEVARELSARAVSLQTQTP